MIEFRRPNCGKHVSVAAAIAIVGAVIALHAVAEGGVRAISPSEVMARALTRPAPETSPPPTLPSGRFAPGKVKLRMEVVACVPKGSRYAELSPDRSRMACYYMKDARAVPFICGEKGDPDKWWYANRFVFARLMLDERKTKSG